MISLLNKKKNFKSYRYIGHLQWVVFFLLMTSSVSWACIPMPLEVEFDKVNKVVFIEAQSHRTIALKTTRSIKFSKIENFSTEKASKHTIFGMQGSNGYFLNAEKAGEYNFSASDGDKKITIRLVVKNRKQAFGGKESIPRSVPKGLNTIKIEQSKGGCGGPSKIKYD